jgi:hypothetical protein
MGAIILSFIFYQHQMINQNPMPTFSMTTDPHKTRIATMA